MYLAPLTSKQLHIFSHFKMGRLENKVSIITGSSSGLGRAIALEYAKEGASVVCADLRPNARAEVPEEAAITTHDLINQRNGRAIFVTTDVGVAEQVDALVTAAVLEFGRVDMCENPPELYISLS